MKALTLLTSAIASILLTSCTKEIITKEEPDNKLVVDFAYSVEILSTGSYYVQYSDASQNVPEGSEIEFFTNGFDYQTINRDGYYSITLTITTPNGIKHSKSHNFLISNGNFFNDVYSDSSTISKEEINIDFAYSLITYSDHAYASFNSACSGIPYNSDFYFYVDGNFISGNEFNFNNEGKHFIVLQVITPNKKQYSCYKEFNITFAASQK